MVEKCVSEIGLQEMSGEVVDSNPYSRLMALKRMGIVNNYEDIRKFSVAIVVSPLSPHLCFFLVHEGQKIQLVSFSHITLLSRGVRVSLA